MGSGFNLFGAIGNAEPQHVLAGKRFSSENGTDLVGTMNDRGAVNHTISTQNGQYTIPQGYHNGTGRVTASFANLVAENVRQGVNIGGVNGIYRLEIPTNILKWQMTTGYTSSVNYATYEPTTGVITLNTRPRDDGEPLGNSVTVNIQYPIDLTGVRELFIDWSLYCSQPGRNLETCSFSVRAQPVSNSPSLASLVRRERFNRTTESLNVNHLSGMHYITLSVYIGHTGPYENANIKVYRIWD